MSAMAEALVARANETYVDPSDIGELFVRAGLVDETLYWLDRAIEDGSYEETFAAFWPHWDVLRDDPRYQDLEKRIYLRRIPVTGGN